MVTYLEAVPSAVSSALLIRVISRKGLSRVNTK